MDKLFELYKRMLELHIKTKTTETLFHEKSELFYTTLFDVFHTISEKRQDLELDDPIKGDEAFQEAYDILEEAKKEIETLVNEDNSIGMDNLLRGLYDKLESECGTARGFTDDDLGKGLEKMLENEQKEGIDEYEESAT